jgi:hypothetical protein
MNAPNEKRFEPIMLRKLLVSPYIDWYLEGIRHNSDRLFEA